MLSQKHFLLCADISADPTTLSAPPPAGDHAPSSPAPALDSGAGSPAAPDAEKDEPAKEVGVVFPGSHDPKEEEEELANLSGVSDISSESMSRELMSPAPAFTGPQTPPPVSGETTPASGPAGVSDISSDNMETNSADVSISETSMETETHPITDGAASELEGGVANPRRTESVMEGPGVEAGGGREGVAESDVGVATSEGSSRPLPEVVQPDPSVEEPVGGAPPSPQSTQCTPSKTPGKRKVSQSSSKVLVWLGPAPFILR